MKKETPIQKLIAELDAAIAKCQETIKGTDEEKFPAIVMTTGAMEYAYKIAKQKALNLLPYEREVIIDFAKTCQYDPMDKNYKTPEQLFNQTFKTK